MKHLSEPGYWARVVGLPVLLVLLTVLVLGSHYETNDDFSITLLLRGRTAAAPVTNLHLYFHGWAWLLARLYLLAPEVPWYGLTLYLLLTLALVLLTAVLEQLLTPHLRPWPRAGLLAAFLVLAGLEHAQWFNYMRVPVLLAGAVVLWAVQHYPARRWVLPLSVLVFATAWAIRPSAAVLGAAVVAPAAWWLGGRPTGRLLAGVATVALLLGLLVQLTRSPEAARYRRLDVLKSEVLDYGWRVPAPRTRADSLGVQAAQEWSFGDSTLVNEAFFRRAYQPVSLVKTIVDKVFNACVLVVRDYFPLLILNALLLLLGLNLPAAPRRWQWLCALGFGGLLLVLAAALKLPPRLAGPLLTLFTVAHAAMGLRQTLRLSEGRTLRPLLLAALVGVYLLKVGHRHQLLATEERAHARTLHALAEHRAGPLVGMQVEEQFKSLSPFRQYVPAGGPPWLLLTGWPTLDPSQARLRQRLSGTSDQPAALRRLRQRPGVRWQNVHAQLPPKPPVEL